MMGTGALPDFITIGLDFTGASSGDVAVEFVGPGQATYQRMTAPLVGNLFTTEHLDFVLPVAGTWIDSQSMTGTWYAHVFFQGSERLTQQFEVTP